MNWTGVPDLRAQVRRLWDRGELPASLVTGEPLFPRRLSLRSPTSAEMTERFGEVRAWIAELREMPHCRIEMRELRHRIFGANAVPDEVWIDATDDALALIGKTRDAARFTSLIEATRGQEARLLAWLAKRPLRALELIDVWPLLLDIVAWIKAHPRPGVYLRQVDLPGVHTKFIEAHRGVLAELFDLVLPPEAIDPTVTGTARFARRYGFLDRPDRVRFRILGSDRALQPFAPNQDITLDAEAFSRLELNISHVFITENEINFLAFPLAQDSIVIFGAGYGFEMLRKAEWLARCRIHYWGDIDTHGFAILDQLREQFGHVESFLMDRKTLMAFEPFWGEEQKQTLRDLPRLHPDEQALYNDLRDNRIRRSLRLEQERIGFGWVETALAGMESNANTH